MKIRISLIGGLAALALAVQAADIYRWVDENGQTHIADSVPDRYKDVAIRIDSLSFEIPNAQHKEAAARAAKEKSAAAGAKAGAGKPGPATGKDAAKSATPATSASQGDDCKTLFRQYRESQECFAPYRLANGALRPEAYSRCKEIPDPSRQCGPTPNY